jgi:CubicO group peptidase (beta-lactamase class C family)
MVMHRRLRCALMLLLVPDQFIRSWLVLGPIPLVESGEPDGTAEERAFAEGGETSLHPGPDRVETISNHHYTWRHVLAPVSGIDLKARGEPTDYSTAYAYTEVDSTSDRTVLFGVGSADAIKMWVNGELVSSKWAIDRPAKRDEDVVPVHLVSGRNRVLLKLQHSTGSWSFLVRPLGERAQGDKVTAAVNDVDTDSLDGLLAQGIKIDARNSVGVTAMDTARVRGWPELTQYLVMHGAKLDPSPPSPSQQMRNLARRLTEDAGPGTQLLVAHDGRILSEVTQGYADLEHSRRVTRHTRFRIGSITKQFTAAAVLLLQEQGRLRIQDRLDQYFPKFPRAHEVTLQQLLSHTSGIHTYTDRWEKIDVAEPVGTPELIAAISRGGYDFDPGTRYSYSNSGFMLLGLIVEKVSGQSYADFLRKRLFEPLHMNDTGLFGTGSQHADTALGYEWTGGSYIRPREVDASWVMSAGALESTAEDLLRWNTALAAGKVLSRASLDTMYSPAKLSDGAVAGYGLGIGVVDWRGVEPVFAHSGGLEGFNSSLMYFPRLKVTVVALENGSGSAESLDAGNVTQSLAQMFFGARIVSSERANPEITPQITQSVVGRYDWGKGGIGWPGGILEVTQRGARLFGGQADGVPRELFATDADHYFWKYNGAHVHFMHDPQGAVVRAEFNMNSAIINAPRLLDAADGAVGGAALDRLTGTYDFGGGLPITVTRDQNHLFAQFGQTPKYEIFPASPMEFFWKVQNARITFNADASGKVVGATLHAPENKTYEGKRVADSH